MGVLVGTLVGVLVGTCCGILCDPKGCLSLSGSAVESLVRGVAMFGSHLRNPAHKAENFS